MRITKNRSILIGFFPSIVHLIIVIYNAKTFYNYPPISYYSVTNLTQFVLSVAVILSVVLVFILKLDNCSTAEEKNQNILTIIYTNLIANLLIFLAIPQIFNHFKSSI